MTAPPDDPAQSRASDRSPPPADEPEERSPFAYPVFRRVWVANLISNQGTLIQSVGASWMMAASGASSQMVALVLAATSLPIVLFSLLAGAIADNLDRRAVMISAQAFIAAITVILALLTYFGAVTPWLLLVFTFLVGCGTALNGPAWQASVGDMVPRQVLPGAVAFNAMGMNLARSIGPAIGGTIVAVAGAAAAFLVNGLSSLVLILALARWRPNYPPRLLPPERLGEAMFSGLRFALMSPRIKAVMWRAILFTFPASATQALIPLVARDLLGGGPLTFGILLGSFGLGAVGGALASKRVRQSLSPEAVVRASTLLTAIGLVGTGASRSLVLTLPALTLAGFGWLLAISTLNVSVQLASPRWVVARALSLYHTGIFGGVAAGSWAIGLCADQVGIAAALLIAAAATLVGLVVALGQPLAPLNRDNLDLRSSWTPPRTTVPIQDSSGPIVVAIGYRIAEENIAEFLQVMSERRRIRLRDGARRWTLLQDLVEAELWIERYDIPTWLDYVRHNSRRTQADAANSEALQRLRIGGSDQPVHRMIERQVGNLSQMRPTGADPLSNDSF